MNIGKLKISYKTLALSFSVFILTSVVFSRLMILGLQNRLNSKAVDRSKNIQILSIKDENLVEKDLNVIENKVLPENFPKDIPVYPGSILKDYWVNDSTEIVGVSVLWEIERSLSEIVDFYKDKFKNLGWETKVILDDRISFTMSFGKEGVDGFIGITKDGTLAVISMTVGVKN
jgi:hypothetical protein